MSEPTSARVAEMTRKLKDPLDRIAAAVAAAVIYDLVDDDDNMGNLQRLAGLSSSGLALVRNRLLILANRLDVQATLPERRAEWSDALSAR